MSLVGPAGKSNAEYDEMVTQAAAEGVPVGILGAAPKVAASPLDVLNAISSVHWFSAFDGAAKRAERLQGIGENFEVLRDGRLQNAIPTADLEALKLTTFCVIVLTNGMRVTGESHCADPAKYDWESGKAAAYDDAKGKIWALENYRIKSA